MKPGDLITDGTPNDGSNVVNATAHTARRIGLLLWLEHGRVVRQSRLQQLNFIIADGAAGILWNTGRMEELPLNCIRLVA